MADTNLDPSISALSTRATEVAASASPRELLNLSRIAPSLEQSENAGLEVAINSRAAGLAPSATATELKSIGKAIGNVLEPDTFTAGAFIPAQLDQSGKFLGTSGTSKNWSGVTVSGLSEVNISDIANDETLVYNNVSSQFENSSQVFNIPQYAQTADLPASATSGATAFDASTAELKYWDGSEWKVAAVVAAAGGGGVSFDPINSVRFVPTYTLPYTQTSGWITVSHSNDLTLTGAFTIEVWVKASGATMNGIDAGRYELGSRTYSIILSKWQNGEEYALATADNGDVRFIWADSNSRGGVVSPILQSGGNVISSGEWVHIAVVRTTDGTFTMYIDGVSVDTTARQIYSVPGDYGKPGNDNIYIGAYYNDGRLNWSWDGLISDLRIVNGTAVYTENFTPPTQPLQKIANTVLLTLRGDTITDESDSNQTVSVSGSASLPTVYNEMPYNTTGSVSFAGNHDYLKVGTSTSNFRFGTGDFTIEFWMKVPSIDTSANPHNLATLLDHDYASAAGMGSWFAVHQDSDRIWWASAEANQFPSNSFITVDTWHHVAITRSSGVTTIYADGVSQGSGWDNHDYSDTSNRSLHIGVQISSSRHYNGFISNLRIVKGTALYTSSYTPPTQELTAISGTTLLCCNTQNNPLSEGTGKTITASDPAPTASTSAPSLSPISSGESAVPVGSVSFLGDIDRLMVEPSSTNFSFGTGDFTIEFWMKVPSTDTSTGTMTGGGHSALHTFFDHGYRDTRDANGAWFALHQSYDTLGWYADAGNLGITTSSFITINTWHHVAITRSAGTTTIYADGTSVGSGSDNHNYSDSVVRVLDIGTQTIQHNIGTASQYIEFIRDYTGFLSNFRIVKGTAVYTSNFTPPTEPLTAITGTVLLCCTTQDNALFDATGKTITATDPAPTASTDAPSLTSASSGESSGESTSSTLDLSTITWNKSVNPHTDLEKVATYGDLVVIGVRSHTGFRGKAYLYNKSTDTTTELVQPSADVIAQGNFGQTVAINDTYIAVLAAENSTLGITGKIYLYDHSGVYQNVRIEGPAFNSFFGQSENTGNGVILSDTYIFVLTSRYSNSSSARVYVYDYTGTEIGYLTTLANDMMEFAAKGNIVLTGSNDRVRKWDVSSLSGSSSTPVWTCNVPSGIGSLQILDDDYFLYTNYTDGVSSGTTQAGYMYTRQLSDASEGARPNYTNVTNPDGDITYGHFGKFTSVNESGIIAVSGRDLSGKVYLYSHSGGVLTYETSVDASSTGIGATATYGHTISISENSLVVGDLYNGQAHIFDSGESASSQSYGPELLTNPSFESEDVSNFSDPITGWNDVASGWYVENSSAIMANTGSWKPLVAGPLGLTIGQTYKAEIVISAITGSIKFDLGTSNGSYIRGNTTQGLGITVTETGTHSFTFTYNGYTAENTAYVDYIGFGRADVSGSSATVDSVSLKRVLP